MDFDQIVGFFTRKLFTIDKIDVSLFTMIAILVPALIFFYLGK